MVYFRVDDTIVFHPRIMAAGDAAAGVWMRCGAWCQQHLTDGRIPKHVAEQIAQKKTSITALLREGLWTEDEDHYVFHRWDAGGRQVSRAQVEAKREADRERIANARASRRSSGGVARESRGTHESVAVAHSTPLHSKEISDEISPTTGKPSRATPTEIVVTKGEFARWWDAYPRHQGRDAAAKAYKAARQRGATTDELLAGAVRYAEDPNRESKFTAHPTTWLNQGRWSDDPLPGDDPRPAGKAEPTRDQLKPFGYDR